jgi:beta-lactamase superfamily II metal-dependent hydrolase
MADQMILRICDVAHGACALMAPRTNGVEGKLAMIDSGCSKEWRPSQFIKHTLKRTRLDYLFITNADQDHMSDLDALWEAGIHVASLTRNPLISAPELRAIKEAGGRPTKDIERFLNIHGSFTAPITEPFNDHMGGIKMHTFYNPYPRFQDTNNLSLAIFFEFCGFKILFPGDLEEEGWDGLFEKQDFLQQLRGLDVLVASHHGRANGYYPALFEVAKPQLVVMSDKSIVHDTQYMAQAYRQQVMAHYPNGLLVRSNMKRRRVLTTRRDGHIIFIVNSDGSFTIDTEHH